MQFFPGLCWGHFLSGSTYSPIMVLLAAIFGLIVVLGANFLQSTGRLAEDASQGVVFPLLFSGGVIMLSTTLAEVHICEDTVLTGDLNLLALDTERLVIGNLDFGPHAMWMLLIVLLLNALFLGFTYKVMQLGTFDRESAKVIGFPIRLVETLFYGFSGFDYRSCFFDRWGYLGNRIAGNPGSNCHFIVKLPVTGDCIDSFNIGGYRYDWFLCRLAFQSSNFCNDGVYRWGAILLGFISYHCKKKVGGSKIEPPTLSR